ncbi:Protein ASYMMETRIC LEAVES 2 [Dionaea muscipula]
MYMAAAASSSPCAACKFLRRKCQPECVFAPYFPPDQPQKFANVHKVFGASNVTKLLNELHPHQRDDAVNSLAYEADMRLRDPVYGCVGVISILQHQLRLLQMDLTCAKSELSKYQSLGGITSSHGFIAAAAAAAVAAHHHHSHPAGHHQGLGISLISGGRDLGHHHHQHQFFPSTNHQQSSAAAAAAAQQMIRSFDVAAGTGYDVGLLGMNLSEAGIGQLSHQLQQPVARVAGGDDRRTVDPS